MDAQKPTEKELLDGLLDQLLKDYKKPEDILGEHGLLKRFSKALLERALGAELTDHLGYEKHDPAGYGSGNARNGTTEKTLKGKNGELTIEVPRDRNGSFEPQIVKKYQTRFDGFDEKILSMYARGMTTRDIQGHLEEIYGVEVSPTLISNVTDAVMDEVKDMAGPAVGGYLSDPVSGRAAREDTRCWARAEPRHLRGDRGEARRRQGSAGAVGRAGGRGKILAAGSDGAEEPPGAGYFHRLCGRAEGITASDRDRLSQSAGAAVHRPLSAELPQLRFLAGAQSSSGRPEADLSCGHQ